MFETFTEKWRVWFLSEVRSNVAMGMPFSIQTLGLSRSTTRAHSRGFESHIPQTVSSKTLKRSLGVAFVSIKSLLRSWSTTQTQKKSNWTTMSIFSSQILLSMCQMSLETLVMGTMHSPLVTFLKRITFSLTLKMIPHGTHFCWKLRFWSRIEAWELIEETVKNG